MPRNYRLHTIARISRLRRYQKMGLTYAEVRTRENLTAHQLSWLLARYEIGRLIRSDDEYCGQFRKDIWTAPEIDILRDLARKRAGADEAARHINRTPGAIYAYAYRNSIHGLRRGCGAPGQKKKWHFCAIWKLYRLRFMGLSYTKCAERMGLTRGNVAATISRYFPMFNRPKNWRPPLFRVCGVPVEPAAAAARSESPQRDAAPA